MNTINFSKNYLKQFESLSRMTNQLTQFDAIYNSPLLKATENISRLATINTDLYHAIQMQEKIYSQVVNPMHHVVTNLDRIYNSPLLKSVENINRMATMNTDLFQAIEAQSKIYNQAFESIQRVVDNLNWSNGLTEAISSITNMQISWENTFRMIREMGQVVDSYNWTEEDEEVTAQDIRDIPEVDYQELCEVIESIRPDKLNWQQRLMEAYEGFKEKNPVIAKVLLYLVITINTILIGVAIEQIGELIGGTKIKTEPTANAPIIRIVEKNTIVNIIGDVPYYYEIIIEDEATKEEIRGWISKRSINTK